jgi:hypothetical protein
VLVTVRGIVPVVGDTVIVVPVRVMEVWVWEVAVVLVGTVV